MLLGFNLHDFLIKPLIARPMERSFPGTMWLIPDDSFWKPTEILVATPQRNYTVKDYKQLFSDLNFTEGINMRQDVEPLIKGLKPPGVEVHCIHGDNVPTMDSFTYRKGQFPDSQPTINRGKNGDGTVNARSLEGCLKWKKQKQPFYFKKFNKVSHLGILEDDGAIKYIKKVLYS